MNWNTIGIHHLLHYWKRLQLVCFCHFLVLQSFQQPRTQMLYLSTVTASSQMYKVVQRLIGVVTYLSKFLPQLSTVAEPLRRLTDQELCLWLVATAHETAFSKIKTMPVTQTPILCFHDKSKYVAIECDSSDVGLGAVITQDGRTIAFQRFTSIHPNRTQLRLNRKGIYRHRFRSWTVWTLHTGQRQCPCFRVTQTTSHWSPFLTSPSG